MKVFITGGTGFIGKHLMQRMAQTEHTIYCLARKTSDTKELKDLGAHIIIGDVNDRASLTAGMQGCDWVLNLANVYSWWEPDKTIYRKVNVEGTRNVMECALEARVSKVVHVSTIGVWGKPEEYPIREETPQGPVRESEYCRTKYEGEQIAWQLYRDRGLPLVVVYPCGVMGTGDPKLTGATIKLLIERRMPARVFDDTITTFVHVKDVAEAVLKAAEKTNNLGEKYIIGNARLSLEKYYELISDVSGVALPKLRMPDSLVMFNARVLTWIADVIKRSPLWGMSIDAMRETKHGWVADGSKAGRDLGIVYTPIKKAIEEEVAWYRQTVPGRIPQQVSEKKAQLQSYWTGEERRSETRNKVDLSCHVEGLLRGKHILEKAHVKNLSRKGMYVVAKGPFDEDTEINTQIKTTRFSEPLWIMGKVLRRTAKGMAIRFTEHVPVQIEELITKR